MTAQYTCWKGLIGWRVGVMWGCEAEEEHQSDLRGMVGASVVDILGFSAL